MVPLTFQDVSLSSDMNFHGVVLSSPALSSRLFTFTVGWGSYFDFCPRPCSSTNRWMGQARNPSDAEDYSHCGVRAITYTLALLPPNVCSRPRDGDVAARHGYFLSASTSWTHRCLHVKKLVQFSHFIRTYGDNFPLRLNCHLCVLQRVFSSHARRHLQCNSTNKNFRHVSMSDAYSILILRPQSVTPGNDKSMRYQKGKGNCGCGDARECSMISTIVSKPLSAQVFCVANQPACMSRCLPNQVFLLLWLHSGSRRPFSSCRLTSKLISLATNHYEQCRGEERCSLAWMDVNSMQND